MKIPPGWMGFALGLLLGSACLYILQELLGNKEVDDHNVTKNITKQALRAWTPDEHVTNEDIEVHDNTTEPGRAGPPDESTTVAKDVPLTFAERVANFPWKNLTDEPSVAASAWADLFDRVFDSNIVEPRVPINTSCAPPVLTTPPNCNQGSGAFSGNLRATPAKLGHAIQLGFDADVLEIHLNEVYDVVDKFFIVEWTSFHNRLGGPGGDSKRLTWEAVKHQPRFRKFHDKVVHFILDDEDAVRAVQGGTGSLFVMEGFQEHRRWEKVAQWNGATGFFNDADVIGFGDTDEVPSRANLHLLKHCELAAGVKSVDIGIWFMMQNMDHAFRTDHPVRGQPYTLGDPTFWTYAAAREAPNHPSRKRGHSGPFLLGGVHMSNQGYLPYFLSKHLSCTECSVSSERMQKWADRFEKAAAGGDWMKLEQDLHAEAGRSWANRQKPLDRLPQGTRDQVVYFPWFYTCNEGRFPMLQGKPDPRTSGKD